MAEQLGPSQDDEALARLAAALGVPAEEPTPRPAAKKAPAKKTAKKSPAKRPAKKAPARRARKAPAKKAPTRKQAAAAKAVADPQVPDEVGGEGGTPEPGEIMALGIQPPAAEAYVLMVKGVPWPKIAEQLEYASGDAASAAVAHYIQSGAIADGVQTARARAQIALETAQQVKAAFWDKAMAGDKDAASRVLEANRDFFRMAGLERSDLTVNSRQTIVITGGSDMAQQLKHAADQAEAARHAADLEADGDPTDLE